MALHELRNSYSALQHLQEALKLLVWHGGKHDLGHPCFAGHQDAIAGLQGETDRPVVHSLSSTHLHLSTQGRPVLRPVPIQ